MVMLETQWITVQQKTFTKWLNNKLKVREVGIQDLVTDLSDGVSSIFSPFVRSPLIGCAGNARTSPRDTRERITGTVCVEAKVTRTAL
jgi:hypothetical protein